MSVFWDQLFSLLIIIIGSTLGISVYRGLRRRFEVLVPTAPKTVQHAIRRRNTAAPEAVPAKEEVASAQAHERSGTLRETSALISALFRELKKPEAIRWIIFDSLAVIVVSIMLALFTSSTIGGLDIYMSTFLPVIGVLIVMFIFTEAVHGSRFIALISAVLILTGIALQGLLVLSDENPSADQLVFFAAVSMALAICGCFVLRLITTVFSRMRMYLLLNAAVIGLYLVLLAFGKNIYGTKAWLVVGGASFQLTELAKVATLVIFGLVFTDEGIDSTQRLWCALISLAVNGVFLLLVNELGTLVILGIAFFLLGFMYLDDIRKLLAVVCILVAFAAVILGGCFLCQQITNGQSAAATEPTAAAEAATEPAEEDTSENMPETIPEANTSDQAQTGEQRDSLLTRLLKLGAKVWRKFALRMNLFLHPEEADPLAEGYQWHKSMNALSLSKALGSAYEVDIPVVESDYIYTFLILKLGVFYSILILAMMLGLLSSGFRVCLSNPCLGEGAVGVAFTIGLVVQSLIAAASATGCFITIGLPFSFLSDGGTASVTNYLMTVFLIYASGHVGTGCCPKPKYVRRKEN